MGPMNIRQKLWYIQQNLNVPKNQYNQYGDFRYRSCEDIQEAVKPILKEVKAVLLVGDEVIQIGDRFYIKATAALQDVESPEQITNTAYAREPDNKPKMDTAQLTGSCSSYARKYALNGLFCIDDVKDPDHPAKTDPETKPGRRGSSPGRTGGQGTRTENLQKEAQRTGTELSAVLARYHAARLEDLTEEQYLRAMSAFKKMPTVSRGQQRGADQNRQRGQGNGKSTT